MNEFTGRHNMRGRDTPGQTGLWARALEAGREAAQSPAPSGFHFPASHSEFP